MSDETPEQGDAVELHEEAVPEFDETKSAPGDRESAGPFDILEVPAMRPYVDLGGLKVMPREGLQLRLEVDERASRVVAVTLDYAESVLQLQAFSAPKSSGLWHRVRGEVAQQLAAQGAKVQEQEGELGPELLVQSQVPADQGGGTRVVRFVGVDGPRWMLRGVIMGKAVVDAEAQVRVGELFREVVVVRGDNPMPPGELLPLKMPAGVQGTANGAAQA
ncbi:MAG: DUF3710 domain-containing protein [Leucobacter sp.]